MGLREKLTRFSDSLEWRIKNLENEIHTSKAPKRWSLQAQQLLLAIVYGR